jgi:hypothetical protein
MCGLDCVTRPQGFNHLSIGHTGGTLAVRSVHFLDAARRPMDCPESQAFDSTRARNRFLSNI